MITYNLPHCELVWNLIKNMNLFPIPSADLNETAKETSKISYGFEDKSKLN